MKVNMKVKRMAISAMIAALYFAACFAQGTFASGAIQCRLSEGLCLLPLFFPEAIFGVALGCLIFNAVQSTIYDVIFGTLATVIAGIMTYFIGRLIKNDWMRIVLGGLPPVIMNALVVPGVLILGMGDTSTYMYLFGTVGLGELIAVYVVGIIIYFPCKKLFTVLGLVEKPIQTNTLKNS